MSSIARQMVGRWGMSEAVGPVSVFPRPGQESPLGLDNTAPATKELVDREVRRIVDECHDEAVDILRAHRDQLNRLAHTLLYRETLDEDEAYAAAGVRRDTAPGALTRGDVPGVPPEPGIPPQKTSTGRDGLPVSGDQSPSGSPSPTSGRPPQLTPEGSEDVDHRSDAWRSCIRGGG